MAAPLLRELGRLRGLALRRGVQRIGCGGRLGAAGGQRGPRIRRSCARVRGFCLQCRAARLELHDLGFRLRPAPGSAAQLCADEHGRQQPGHMHTRVAWRRPQCRHQMHVLAVLIPELLHLSPCEYPLRAESGDTRRQACSRSERQTSCAHPAAQLFLRTGGRLPLRKHLRFDQPSTLCMMASGGGA